MSQGLGTASSPHLQRAQGSKQQLLTPFIPQRRAGLVSWFYRAVSTPRGRDAQAQCHWESLILAGAVHTADGDNGHEQLSTVRHRLKAIGFTPVSDKCCLRWFAQRCLYADTPTQGWLHYLSNFCALYNLLYSIAVLGRQSLYYMCYTKPSSDHSTDAECREDKCFWTKAHRVTSGTLVTILSSS